MAKASVALQNGAVHWTVIRDSTGNAMVASLALAVAFAVLKFGNREHRSEGEGNIKAFPAAGSLTASWGEVSPVLTDCRIHLNNQDNFS